MGSLLLDQIKKQTTNFLQEKYKTARMTFTDVTGAELLAEEATNKDDCSPDAKTMTQIAEASFDIDEYWRIVDVLHRRLYNVDWEEWRQSYKALVLLEFMLTHGPIDFAQEFQCDAEIIEELGSFTHIDERGFNWGFRMQKLSNEILKLLQGGEALKQAQSPSSFCSFSTTNTSINNYNIDSDLKNIVPQKNNVDEKNHWNDPAAEEILIDSDDGDDSDGEVRKSKGFVSEMCSKIIGGSDRGKIEFRCISDVGRKDPKKRYDRQYSLWF
ncbi:ENTH/VHS family protein [Trifolium repens]|nr:ENTH/VHS family protein [Trifolium repens]